MLCLGMDDFDRLLRDWASANHMQTAQHAVQLAGTCELLIQRMPGDVSSQLQQDVVASVLLFFQKFEPSRYVPHAVACSCFALGNMQLMWW